MSVFDRIAEIGVVPVVEIDDASDALGLADALIEGGLPVAEITFRTAAAGDALRLVAKERPEVLIGAGTVLTVEQVDESADSGVRFALSPGFDAQVVERSRAASLPFIPGAMTPSDVLAALGAGCKFIKFFPAAASGGPAMLKSIAGPFMNSGVRFNPTGGISEKTLSDWLAMPSVFAVGGTWIAPRKEIASRNWRLIASNARKAVAAANASRDRA